MTNTNERHLKLMLQELDIFRSESKTSGVVVSCLGALVSRLNELLSALEAVDTDWKRSFMSNWGVLEDAYACSLDQSLQDIPNENVEIVVAAVACLRRLVIAELVLSEKN